MSNATNELHTKRRKRISLRKIDHYRATAAFFKQRNQTLVGDLRKEQGQVSQLSDVKDILGRDKSELQNNVIDLEKELHSIKKIKAVRFILWITGSPYLA
jgi:hypothetical protein